MEILDWQRRENGCVFMVRSVLGVVFCTLIFSPPRDRAIFSTFWGDFLTKLYIETGERERIHWRKFEKSSGDAPEIADFCPWSWSNVSC